MTCNPLRWLWGLIPIAMLSWIAVHREAERIELDLEHRARLVLSAAGYDWVSVVVSGRNALLAGTTDNPHDIPEVNHLVHNVWGVHRVIDRTRFIELKQNPRAPADRKLEGSASARSIEVPRSEHVAAAGAIEMPKDASKTGEPANASGAETAAPAPAKSGDAAPEAGTAGAGATEPSRVAPVAEPSVAPAEPTPPSIAATQARGEAARTAAPPESHDEKAARPEPAEAAGAPATASESSPSPAAAAAAPAQTPNAATAPVASAVPASPAAPAAPPAEKATLPAAAPDAPAASGGLHEAGAVAAVSPIAPPVVAPVTPPGATSPATPQTTRPATTRSATAASAEPSSGAERPEATTATLPAHKDEASQSACKVASHEIAALPPLRFARGSTALGRRNRSALDQLAKVAASCPAITLRVSGHADTSGQSQRNVSLAQKRAGAAVGYLIARGIDGGRLSAVGYGDSRPVAPNDNEGNRAKNRRIEFEVSGYPEGTVKEQGAGNGLPDD